MEIEGYYPQTSYSLGPRIVFQPWSKWSSYELARGYSTRLITPNTSQLCSKHWKKYIGSRCYSLYYQGTDSDRGTTWPWFEWLGDMVSKECLHACLAEAEACAIPRGMQSSGESFRLTVGTKSVVKSRIQIAGFPILPLDNSQPDQRIASAGLHWSS